MGDITGVDLDPKDVRRARKSEKRGWCARGGKKQEQGGVRQRVKRKAGVQENSKVVKEQGEDDGG